MSDRHIPLQIEGDKVVGVGDASFTPGPWVVESIGAPRVLANDAKGMFPVCDIRGWGHLTGKGHGALGLSVDAAIKIQDANARLIAAAPELLAFAQYVAGMDDGNPAPLFEKARSAIAKATGAA